MQIRRAQIEDLSLLRDFAERTFREAYEAANLPEPFNAYCKQAFAAEQFRSEMEDPNATFWLGYLEDVLVAYMKLKHDVYQELLGPTKSIQIERIYIDAGFQGRGFGEIALGFAHDQAKEADATWIWLSVWQENPRAVRFYERNGFEIFGTEIFDVADDPQLDWVMRRKVSV
jgi:ribosomal protein S18 acetylase RimI-like enzyme